MAASDTEIVNLALSHLGSSKEIANLETENSAEARAGRRFYETCRKKALREFKWPFATKYAALGLVATTPSEIDQEWAYSYRYPSEALRVWRLVSGIRPETRQSAIPFQRARDAQGQLIYTNQPSAEAEYTYNETDVSRFPDDFVLAFSLLLAVYMAPRLTGGDPFKLGPRALQLYGLEKSMAQASALNEEQPDEEAASEFERSRE